jgi:hypothetical protein
MDVQPVWIVTLFWLTPQGLQPLGRAGSHIKYIVNDSATFVSPTVSPFVLACSPSYGLSFVLGAVTYGKLALLIFFAFAMQCISTIAVVRRDTGGWKWPILQFSHTTVLAYVGAFAAFHLIR